MNNASTLRTRPGGGPVLLALFLTAAVCQGCQPVTLKTIELQPAGFATGRSGVSGSTGYCFSAGHPPPSPFSAGSGQVLVGFDDFFQAGSDPFPCDDIRAVAFRAGVRFDLSQFDSIVAADLLFDTVTSITRSGGGATIGRSPGLSSATTLGQGTGAFTTAMPDDNEASLPGGTNINIGVSGQVRDWVSNSRPNFGFVIGGPRGPVNSSSPPKDNDAQLSWYSNIRLRVIYNPALNKRAPQ